MKKLNSVLVIIVGVFAMSCNLTSDNQSIKVEKTATVFRFEASYPKYKTKKVIAYIENSLNDNELFTKVDDEKDLELNSHNRMKFHLHAKPGYIEIKFFKNNNSETGYNQLESLCQGIKEELK